MGHKDHSLCTVVNGIFDGWDSSGDTLGVGNFLIGVERDVEVDLDGTVVVSGMLLDVCVDEGSNLL